MAKLNIFVSSTCYDLSQIRNDIKQCILELGHNPILSELKEFPVNPNLSNAENCINAVKNEADIFVLIIGNKYGSELDSGRSITNTEFVTAVDKGIPIYTFALKQMTTILPLWERNPDMDLSSVVDNKKVFEFLADVRKKRGLWNFEFEKAQDITEILKSQLSNLFCEALKVRRRIESLGKKDYISKISSKALDIIIRKEEFYEARFFLQSMYDEIQKYSSLKNDYKYSVLFKSSNRIGNIEQLLDWTLLKFGQAQNYIGSLNNLQEAFTFFFKEPGTPSDLEGLYYVASSYARSYACLLEWGIEVKSMIVPDKYKKLLTILAEIPSDSIRQIEEFPIQSLKLIEDCRKQINEESQKTHVLSLNLKLTINDDIIQRYKKELEVLKKKEFYA
ncbi:MAG: DUF4062 domain-containing protein [Paludibacteraceae bacterium]|nr:DUF4062 domain-containing protein [Paludibacteraceae bacterium]